MPTVTICVAKAMSRLIEAASPEKSDVVIVKGGTPVVRLVPVPQRQFKFGVLGHGALGEGSDFLSPMDEEELAAWEGRS